MSLFARLLDADALACVAAHLPATDAFTTALACRALRDALRARFPDGFRSCKTAAFAGSVARAQWALAHGVLASPGGLSVQALRPFLFDCAERHMARAGNWDVIAWALDAGLWSWDDKGAIFDTLAARGHLGALQRFRERGDFSARHSHSAIGAAASHGQRAVLEWLRDVRAPHDAGTGERFLFAWSDYDRRCAVLGGHVELVRWMKSVDPRMPQRLVTDLYDAARSGSLPMIEYAWEDMARHRPGELSRMTADSRVASIYLGRAAERGGLAAVQWLVAKGLAPGYHAVARAVLCDNWEVAAWLAAAVGWDEVREEAEAAEHASVCEWLAHASPAKRARVGE